MNDLTFDDDRLPDDKRQRIERELGAGETLLWTGQPIPRLMGRKLWPIVLFGIPWTAFAVFWTLGAGGMLWFGDGPKPNQGPFMFFSICFPMFGLPFIAVGVGMLTAPYWARRMAAHTCYALTDQRAIVFQGGWRSVEVMSYRPEQLGKLRRVENYDGTGDIVFEDAFTFHRDSRGSMRTSRTPRGFIAIPRVKEIEELIRKALLSEPK